MQKSRLILASASPRRKELLATAGVFIRVVPSNVDEQMQKNLAPEYQAMNLAMQKAQDVARHHPEEWVLGADTMVVRDGHILNKPVNETNARDMLSSLSGREHQVVTGWSLVNEKAGQAHKKAAVTRVWFKPLTKQEISWYVSTGEPMDKAGAYGIQGMGMFLVKKIHGSYTNVVGLPMCEVLEFLFSNGIIDRNHE